MIGNKFELSDGNLKVLEMIPRMMRNESYRNELRKLCLDFLSEQVLKDKKGEQK